MRSSAEIRFRLKQELANVVLRALPPSPGRVDAVSPLSGLPDPAAVAEAAKGTPWASELLRLAEQILEGRVPLFETLVDIGTSPAWRRDFRSGIETPPIFFRRIPYLNTAKCGDHKNIWELSRHQHLVLVAQAFVLTGDSRYCDFVKGQLRHWWRENPFQCGINWASALEVAMRALSWIWIFHFLGPGMDDAFRREILMELYRHGLHLEYNLSLYFSPNTHLLGEALALHAIGRLFPNFPRSSAWRKMARSILVEEFSKQVHADGGYFEQSTYYHVYALDMFLFHHLLEPLPDPDRLRSMAEFLAAVIAPDGTLPFLGDDDGGRFFYPFGPRGGFARATLATCSAVLGQEYFHYSEPDLLERDLLDQAAWWLGPQVMAANPATLTLRSSRYFPQSGLVSMRSGDVRVLFDAGEFGPWGGGHSHSDTLSFVAAAGQREILIDPGTYTYVGDPEWRNRFRGSAFHNTIRVDGRDQADPAGPFRWLNKPGVEVLSWHTTPALDTLEAVCTYAGIRHRRHLSFAKEERLLTILDVVEGEGEHEIEQFWHAGEPVSEIAPGRWRIGECAELTVEPDARSEIVEGWRSDVLGAKRPAPVIRVHIHSALPARLGTVLRLGGTSGPGC